MKAAGDVTAHTSRSSLGIIYLKIIWPSARDGPHPDRWRLSRLIYLAAMRFELSARIAPNNIPPNVFIDFFSPQFRDGCVDSSCENLWPDAEPVCPHYAHWWEKPPSALTSLASGQGLNWRLCGRISRSAEGLLSAGLHELGGPAGSWSDWGLFFFFLSFFFFCSC